MHLWPTNLSAIFLRAFRAGKNLGQTVEKQVFGNAYYVPEAVLGVLEKQTFNA